MVDVFLETTGAVIAAFIFYTLYRGIQHPQVNRHPGTHFVLIGFGLILFGLVIDITDNFPELNFLIFVGDTETQAFLEKVIGTLLGLTLLAMGFRRWIPSILQLESTRIALDKLNEELDQRVQQRTKALNEANIKLKKEVCERKQAELNLEAEKREHLQLIDRLEQAQNQLQQSEKMASIGQLAAGVAHEINNPVGFIKSNLNSLRSYIDDLIMVLDAYRDVDEALRTSPALMEKIERARTKADIDFLMEDVNSLVSESQEGIERVKQIVRDLKDFSRSGSREYKLYDLHQGISSTLNVAHNEIKYKANVVKEFGELPGVFCCLPQINQVVLNLLVNAAQAIEGQGTIFLRTGLANGQVWIEVEDTGKGIAAKDLNRIFDPFFTTKPVGKGTGLGLSLSYGIVQEHGGEIEVHSEPGVGSRFRVWLPLKSEDPVFDPA